MLLRTLALRLVSGLTAGRSRTSPARWIGVGVGVGVVIGLAGVAGAAGSETSAGIGFETAQNLSPSAQLTAAEALLNQMAATTGTTARQLKEARLARDVIRILCLNDKLSQADVTTQTANERMKSLRAAVKALDTELGNHEFTILTVLGKRSAQLGAEANQCVGQESAFTGTNEVTGTIDPGMNGTSDPNASYPIYDPSVHTAPPSDTFPGFDFPGTSPVTTSTGTSG
jgi:hypothetical protein